MSTARGRCPVCMYSYRLKADGRVQRHHGFSGHDPLPDCRGSGMMPLREPPSPGLAKLAALEPRRIIVAGDWHGNSAWAVRVIRAAKSLLRDEPLPPLILHLGDFGIWPGTGGGAYLREVRTACAELGVRIWFIDGNHECVDTRTRALTRRGFLGIDKICPTDEVLSVDDNGARVWQPITGIIRRPADVLWDVRTRGLSMGITGGHRVVGHPRGKTTGRWVEYRGDDMRGRTMTVVTGARNGSPDAPGVTDDEIRLLAWCLTDSHYLLPYGYWRFYQRASKADRITELLTRLELPHTTSTRQRSIDQIHGKQLRVPPEAEVTVRVTAEGSRQIRWQPHRVPDEALGWSRRQVEVLLEELVYCDGSTPTTGSQWTHVLYCPESELRESLQILLVANGFRCTATLIGANDWRLNICDRLGIDLDLRRGAGVAEQIPYEGDVWCLQVPNGRFFVERDGKPHLTGNCFTQLEKFRGGDPVRWLPRGTRWNWHGRTWLALGGGVSLDRAIRTEGRDWWPEEEITRDQAAEVTASGPAHVMVTHDCPASVVHTFPPAPRFWDMADLARNDRHRERLQGVVDAVRPGWLLHGHLHVAYQRMTDLGYGPVEVTGLDRDEGRGANWAVLDIKTMRWEAE